MTGFVMHTLTHVSAAPYSTFKFEANLASVSQFESLAELKAFDSVVPPVVLGEGSNTIFLQDLTVPVCRFIAKGKSQLHLDEQYVLLHIEAGHNWHQLVSWTVEQGLWGLENLALIPGSVGAAPVQNIGAYGVELADSCVYVDFYHWQKKEVQRIRAARCQFAYRDSIFKKELAGKGIIVAVGLCLSKLSQPVLGYKGLDHLANNTDINAIFEQVIAVRRSKLPDPAELANCGSFFKNPVISTKQFMLLKQQYKDLPGFTQADGLVKLPAAWLIEQQGFKGKNIGNIGCYKLQPLVVVNHGGGKASELLQLIDAIRTQVKAAYNIDLEVEVRLLNDVGEPTL